MSGSLAIIGLGPGPPGLLAPDAAAALAEATDLVGYTGYLDRLPARPRQRRHPSGNGEELVRARHALELTAAGRRVGVVSAGDAGVFGMAAAVFEAIDHGPAAWRRLAVRVIPGISALLAAAARIGAPLGQDFCVLSLSDNLKPWPTIERRLRAAASAELVMALYNPVSRARPWQLQAAFTLLRPLLPASVPVIFATAIGAQDERVRISRLRDADAAGADMRTLVLIGSPASRTIVGPGGVSVYTPRGTAGSGGEVSAAAE